MAVAAIAPMRAEPSVRTEQVSQLLLGETADLVGTEGMWRRVRTHDVGYEGWIHAGYLRELDAGGVAAWRERAAARSEGARLTVEGSRVALPFGARVALEAGEAALPDGRRGAVAEGRVRTAAEIAREAAGLAPERWALDRFAGAPYQWGGRSEWGIDCSALVQATFAARGVQLPRDSGQQIAAGEAVEPAAMQPGDLLFFRSESGRDVITHVAFVAAGDTLVHSTIDRGGVVHESWAPGSRAHSLRDRLAAVRRV